MSGGDKTSDGLTDQQRIDQQVAGINVTSAVSEVTGRLFGHSGRPVFGKTNFEGHSLNALVDLVHGTNPADLEHASETLGDAGKAINEAAEELRRHLAYAGQDWKGEAGEAFQKWGAQLATHTEALGKYAEDAKVQISAAAIGLASVRSAMPSRDTRPADEQKKPSQFPEAKQVDGNRQYAEAVRVEKDRQEAINQMNRLASFYSVSGGELARLEPPVFEVMPNVGVPKAPDSSGGRVNHVSGGSGGTTGVDPGADRRAATTLSHGGHIDVSQSTPEHSPAPSAQPATDSQVKPHQPTIPKVGTETNSVGTLPSDTAQVAPTAPSSGGLGPHGPSAGTTVPPGTAGTLSPAFGGLTGRASGAGGMAGSRGPVSAQGRVAAPGGTAGGARGGRGPLGPVGRTTGAGQPGARGPASATGRTPMGRGVTGGIPRTAGAGGPRTGGAPGGRAQGGVGQSTGRTGPGPTGAARAGGVVGGKPTAETGPTPNGTRVPRGTVVGGETASNARAAGERPGQRGVISANNGQPSRRSLPVSSRVVGASAERGGARDKTPTGGSGRRARRQRNAAEGEERRDGDTPSETD